MLIILLTFVGNAHTAWEEIHDVLTFEQAFLVLANVRIVISSCIDWYCCQKITAYDAANSFCHSWYYLSSFKFSKLSLGLHTHSHLKSSNLSQSHFPRYYSDLAAIFFVGLHYRHLYLGLSIRLSGGVVINICQLYETISQIYQLRKFEIWTPVNQSLVS